MSKFKIGDTVNIQPYPFWSNFPKTKDCTRYLTQPISVDIDAVNQFMGNELTVHSVSMVKNLYTYTYCYSVLYSMYNIINFLLYIITV